MSNPNSSELWIDAWLRHPGCTIIEPKYRYPESIRQNWSPENYTKLEVMISRRMRAKVEWVIYLNYAKTREETALENVLLMIAYRISQLSEIDESEQKKILSKGLNTLWINDNSGGINIDTSVIGMLLVFEARKEQAIREHTGFQPCHDDDEEERFQHLDDDDIERTIAQMNQKKPIHIHLDNIWELSSREQQRVAEIISKQCIGYWSTTCPCSIKINNGANNWGIWHTRAGETIASTHDYSSYSVSESDVIAHGT